MKTHIHTHTNNACLVQAWSIAQFTRHIIFSIVGVLESFFFFFLVTDTRSELIQNALQPPNMNAYKMVQFGTVNLQEKYASKFLVCHHLNFKTLLIWIV